MYIYIGKWVRVMTFTRHRVATVIIITIKQKFVYQVKDNNNMNSDIIYIIIIIYVKLPII